MGNPALESTPGYIYLKNKIIKCGLLGDVRPLNYVYVFFTEVRTAVAFLLS
jgi:hypothetical protein